MTNDVHGLTDLEDVESFRQRVRAWLPAMPRLAEGKSLPGVMDLDTEEEIAHDRALQRMLWDGGFAGICFPRVYGGLGLSAAHQDAFNQEAAGYELPVVFNMPTLSILAPTLLDYGTEEQKVRHIPAMLRGDELWVQFLSEPDAGSDLAACTTNAVKDGDVWVVNGAKIWSSGAWRSDYAMCLARTNWDVPKHAGLTMFLLPIHHPGVRVERIRQVDGSYEFCQEFFDDALLPADSVIGAVNDGWSVATSLLSHERTAVGGSSPYISGGGAAAGEAGGQRDLIALAEMTGRTGDPRVRQLLGEAHTLNRVHSELVHRISTGLEAGVISGPMGAILRLNSGLTRVRKASIAIEIADADAAAWSDDDVQLGEHMLHYIGRQGACLAGGSTEMQRNIISERILNMPREHAADRGIAFRDIPRGHRS